MTVFALVILGLVFHCSDCNENQGQEISASNKTQIACAQLRASNCSFLSDAMRQDYRSFKAGKVKLNIKKHVTRLSWDAALRVCQSEGGMLVKIDTKEKEAVIKENIKIERKFGKPDYLWLGLRYFKETNKFMWTDKSPLVHEKWGTGEPIHAFKRSDGTVVREDCVALAGHFFLGTYWNDLPCGRKYGFICEV